MSKSGTLFRLIETRALGYKGHGRLEKMNADLAQLSKIMLYGKTLFMRNNWKIRISGLYLINKLKFCNFMQSLMGFRFF